MSEQGFLEIDGISKSFGVVDALKDVTFSVRKGEIHALLGENGAGKSTLVKIIKGELVPDRGELRLDGRNIDEFSPQKSMELGIAIVHQELAIFENMTVAENIFPISDFLVRQSTKLNLPKSGSSIPLSRYIPFWKVGIFIIAGCHYGL